MPTSFLLVEELFATGDDGFVAAVRDFHVPGSLATIAEKWRNDPRPWAREQILRYLELPLDAPGHETVVKRLFKKAEEIRDDELMAAFAVAFDRLVRRKRVTRFRYDWQTRQSWSEEQLFAPRDVLATPSPSAKLGPVVPEFRAAAGTTGKRRLFSFHTRYYLRRRAWRYFRRVGYQRPADYPAAVSRMLKRYHDIDLAKGEHILDSWSLLHACFGESNVLRFGASVIRLEENKSLRELAPAPQFPDLWNSPQAGLVLVDVLMEAGSRLVRVWASGLLRARHDELLRRMPVRQIRRLLDHPDEEIQLLGAEVLERSSELDKLPVAGWLELLLVQNPMVLETIVRLMALHVRAERLDLAQCVQLAAAKPAPVARLGFEFLRHRDIEGEADLALIADLADARCAVMGAELARWALARLGTPANYEVAQVGRFFDSLLLPTRGGAWQWLVPGSAGWDDAALWSRLVETPYDDVRMHFVSALQDRLHAPGLGAGQLALVWAGVLLGIHRGGRHKLIALRQISDAVGQRPEDAELLLPVLAVAIRSVRPPEARAGLAAVVGAVEKRPELTELISRLLPELQLQPQGVET